MFESHNNFLFHIKFSQRVVHGNSHSTCNPLSPFIYIRSCRIIRLVNRLKIMFKNLPYFFLVRDFNNNMVLDSLNFIMLASLSGACMENFGIFVSPLYQLFLALRLQLISSCYNHNSISFSRFFMATISRIGWN